MDVIKYNIHIANLQSLIVGDSPLVEQDLGDAHVDTSGGAYIAGNVNTSSGDIIGRDNST